MIGILLPALWWIPEFGIRSTFVLLAATALLPRAAGLLLVEGRRKGPRLAAAALVPAGLSFVPNAVVVPHMADARVLYAEDSGLQHIRVLERDAGPHRRRYLQLNEAWSIHSVLLEPELVTGDVWDAMAASALFVRPDDGRLDVLILGLAGGTVSNLISRWIAPTLPGLSITGVEIDPAVLDVAESHLGLDRRHLRTHVGDARVWLRASRERFDLIVLDAYAQPSIPAHMATREFFADVRAHLEPEGVALLNVYGPAAPSRLVDGLGATWNDVFEAPQVYTAPPRDGLASRLFFSRAVVGAELRNLSDVPAPLRPVWSLLARRTRDYAPPADTLVWSDDRAPVELWTDLAYRRQRPPNPPRVARERTDAG